ncbi:MAG: site-specific DNA-methyltransferase [Sulfurimonadaceae bacterium]
MDTLSFKQHIENLFKNSSKFSDSEGNLDIHTILESIESIDTELIKVLKNDEKAKETFFTQIEDIYILNQNRLIEFFALNDYMKNGSYTSYTNKIGLIKKDSFIKKFDDVVLAFPHKDCVLEGGQTKDDDKSKEVFYNEIIASDEIDRLFEPKVLTNIKRYSKDGVEDNPMIQDDDNLIIKGNNLIALHSLKKKYAGQVKLIYIDPPYNTGNDSFKYNDNFNHSTWLTFMKNRLEIAREFLSDEGVIFVQCDDNEQAYLKVLMDEVFSNGYLQTVSIKKATAAGFKSINLCPITTKEFIFIYGKNNNGTQLQKIYIETGYVNDYDTYIQNISDKPENWEFISLKELFYKSICVEDWKSAKIKLGDNWRRERDSFIENFAKQNYKNIISFKDLHKPTELVKSTMDKSKKDRDKIFILERENQEALYFKKGRSIAFYKNKFREVNGKFVPTEILSDIWIDIKWDGISKEGEITLKNGKKPEKLLQRIINLSTQPNDLVMDFHLGSGTTCAVAHKMGRKYIGIEQMDYIEDISVERLKKVVDGEQGGISKAVNWQGGGSFIYAELKQINNFKNSQIKSLNKNIQYLPIDEIEDEDYAISKEEIAINKAFYGLEDE